MIKKLNLHSNLYYWKKNNYFSTKHLEAKDILIELLEKAKDGTNISKLYKENVIRIIKNKEEELAIKKEIMKQLPESLKSIVKINNHFGGKLGDNRKANIMKSNSAFEKIIKVIEKHTKVSSENIHMLIPHEIEDFTKNYKCYEERFQRRKKRICHISI